MLTSRRRISGAATIEFYIVSLLALLPLCTGMLQTALLLVANHHVDHAAFMAARTGAVSGGDLGQMRRAFAQALSPLLVSTAGGIDSGNLAERVLGAQARSAADLAIFLRLEVTTPDTPQRADFAIERDGHRVIPNDSLEFRSMGRGERSGATLQQANILRIEAVWCHPLLVPLATEFLLGLLRTLDHDPWHQLCYRDRRVPIKSTGVAPMQSDFRIR